MESDSLLSTIALAASLVVLAFAAVGEASIASVRRERVQNLVSQKIPGASSLEQLHSMPMGPTGGLTLLMIFSLVAGLLSAVTLIVARVGTQWTLVAVISLLVLVAVGIIQGISKTVASSQGERVALRAALLARVVTLLLYPILAIQSSLFEKMLKPNGDGTIAEPEIFPTDINLPIDSSGEPLDEREVRMIRGVVQLDQTTAREIMVPRVDMVAVEKDTNLGQVTEEMLHSGHSRIPVYRDNLDRIEGIVYARDVLRHMVEGDDTSSKLVESVIRPVLFIPESKTLEELLNEFQQRRVHMAIVVDEYGGVSGLVTIEDLLEEIVGEIQDEFDVGEPEFEPVGDREFIIDARLSIDQVNELLSISVEGDGFDTLGGFVYHRLGKIPGPGDTVDYDGLKIEVISTVGRRLKRLRVTKSLPQDAEES